jgi:hypothetical protein
MKTKLTISILVILVALLAAVPALAIPGKGAVKGEVTIVDLGEGTVTIETNKGETVKVAVPQDFDIEAIEVGDWVLVKGTAGQDESMEAEWVKQVGKGRGKNDDQDKPEGKKDNSAFCDDGKQEKPHPLAAKISERFEVPDEDWVMDNFCAGYGMGAIMLALKTSELDGGDPGALLEDRAQGQGWGQIWKDMDLIGSEKEGHSPPGLLNRPDHAGPKDKDD